MNRLKKTMSEFQAVNRKAFVPYMMAGDGGLECLTDRLLTLEQFGAAAIEIGVPFSDPVADGPTIQRAGIRALQSGTTLKGIVKELREARNRVSLPLILMTYFNPVLSYGLEKFFKDIAEADIDGLIIPDLPVEEEEIIAPFLEKTEVELIRLVTLTTPMERIEQIASMGNGFLYTVTIKGITGVRNHNVEELTQFLRRVKEVSKIPVLAGFGISTGQQIADIAEYCDGVIVGSKVVELFEQDELNELKSLISVLNPQPAR